jgi:hypothetical protein
MSRLVVLVPTRGRPENIVELLQAFKDTNAEANLVIVCDEDDPKLEEYKATGANGLVYPREGKGMAKPLNKAANELAYRYDFFAFMGDDHRPRTQGWDIAIQEELSKLGTGLAYGNDLIQGAGLPTAVFMTADIVRTLGGMVPPNMIHLYLDNFWLELGRDLNAIAYREDVIIEHLHPIAGKAQWDEQYREVNAQEVYSADAIAFKQYMASDEYKHLIEELTDQA